MSVETSPIELDEEDLDLAEVETIDDFIIEEESDAAEVKKPAAETDEEEQDRPDALEEIIARFGGDSKEWDKTHDEAPSLIFRDGKLWSDRDDERSITDQIEEQATPEQVALHHSINEKWGANAAEVQLIDYKEATETGHILHVTALWLEQGNVVVSETWSREVKDEALEQQGEDLVEPAASIGEPEAPREILAEEPEPDQDQSVHEVVAEQQAEVRAEADIDQGEDQGQDQEDALPTDGEIAVVLNSVKDNEEEAQFTTTEDAELEIEAGEGEGSQSEEREEGGGETRQEIPAVLERSPFWAPIFAARTAMESEQATHVEETAETENADSPETEIQEETEEQEQQEQQDADIQDELVSAAQSPIETAEELVVLNSVKDNGENRIVRDDGEGLEEFFASLVQDRALDIVFETAPEITEQQLQEFFSSLVRDSGQPAEDVRAQEEIVIFPEPIVLEFLQEDAVPGERAEITEITVEVPDIAATIETPPVLNSVKDIRGEEVQLRAREEALREGGRQARAGQKGTGSAEPQVEEEFEMEGITLIRYAA